MSAGNWDYSQVDYEPPNDEEMYRDALRDSATEYAFEEMRSIREDDAISVDEYERRYEERIQQLIAEHDAGERNLLEVSDGPEREDQSDWVDGIPF